MRTLLALLSITLASSCLAADTAATYDMSFNLQGSAVDESTKMAAIARIDKEVRGIARAVLGPEIAEGLKLAVRKSKVPNGFSTHIECYLSLATALGHERLVSVHQAFGERFKELVADTANANRIADPAYLPLPDFVARYRKTG
jgi:hypothetical protein